mmetsp:Transcript_782/g.2495  ORF Transcript_782/g.2495 Transcript_782/m.2495 type:complete len:127 (-) Transcript_782:59-439(-)
MEETSHKNSAMPMRVAPSFSALGGSTRGPSFVATWNFEAGSRKELWRTSLARSPHRQGGSARARTPSPVMTYDPHTRDHYFVAQVPDMEGVPNMHTEPSTGHDAVTSSPALVWPASREDLVWPRGW